MKTSFSINDIPIKRPHTFKIERYRITKSNRLSSGLMSMENIARKRKFYFTWEAIESKDLNTILDAIWETDECFFTLKYVESNVQKSAVCYVGSIPTDLHRTSDGSWIWKDVSMNFIEQ